MEGAIVWAWIIWLAIGAFAGWLAGKAMGSRPFGLFGDIFFGIVGSLIGAWVFSLFGVIGGGFIWSFIIAFIGALLLLWVVRLFKKV